MRKKKTVLIDGWLPEETLRDLKEVADMAGVKLASALKLALAVEARRWNRENGVRAERDVLLVFAREVAIGAYRPKELRARAQAVIAATSHVPPNDQIQRAP